jgi:hypothetical protein
MPTRRHRSLLRRRLGCGPRCEPTANRGASRRAAPPTNAHHATKREERDTGPLGASCLDDEPTGPVMWPPPMALPDQTEIQMILHDAARSAVWQRSRPILRHHHYQDADGNVTRGRHTRQGAPDDSSTSSRTPRAPTAKQAGQPAADHGSCPEQPYADSAPTPGGNTSPAVPSTSTSANSNYFAPQHAQCSSTSPRSPTHPAKTIPQRHPRAREPVRSTRHVVVEPDGAESRWPTWNVRKPAPAASTRGCDTGARPDSRPDTGSCRSALSGTAPASDTTAHPDSTRPVQSIPSIIHTFVRGDHDRPTPAP